MSTAVMLQGGVAIPFLLVLVVVAIVAIPVLIRVFGEAVRRNPDDEQEEEGRERRDE